MRGTSGAKPGAQPGHKGKTLKRVAQPDHIKIHPVAPVCDACGQQIESTRITVLPEGRQVIDLPPTRFEVTEHRVQVAQCACGKRHSGVFPESVSQAVQYGPQIRAAAVYLTQYQQLPVARTVQALGDLFGLRVSTGTVQQSIDEAARLLAPAVKQISDALREQPVVHFDESSMRVGRICPSGCISPRPVVELVAAPIASAVARRSTASASFPVLRASRCMTAGGRTRATSVNMRCATLTICVNWCSSRSQRNNPGPSR